jgi:hypothetical protein
MNNAIEVKVRDLIVMARGSLEILNECQEPLVRMVDVKEWVAPIEKVLSKELLDREVVSLDSQGVLTIVVKGVDDAE